jgi:outer membrane protein assembly factor BamB
LPAEPTVLNQEIEGAVLVYENNLGRPGKRLRSSVDLAYNYISLEGDDNLYCLNAGGKILWKYQIPGGIFDFKTSIEGKFVAVASGTGGMFYLDNTGKLLWSYSLGRAIPIHEVSPDGSTVVATTIPPSGKGNTLCILTKAGQVLRHLSIPYEVLTLALSFDGSVILTGDLNQNIAQYAKTGDRQWIYNIRAPVHEVAVSQSGLLIFALTNEIISVSPSGTERWRIRLPEGPVQLVRMSHDGSVNIGCGAGTIIRFDLKGKILWKHPMPTRKTNFQLSYRSYNIVLPTPSGIDYWDKYGYAISSFGLPGADRTPEDCITVSQDGRYILSLDDSGVLRQMDIGRVLAQHLISASRIFMDELKRLGTVTPGAEENLQWAVESMNDGDVQYALSFGSQAYTSMEGTLDSLPTRKPSVEPPKPAATPAPAAATKQSEEPGTEEPPSNAAELYKKGLKEIFSVKDEPTEIEWSLLTILREAFNITAEEHDAFEEEVKTELKAAQPAKKAPPGQVRTVPISPTPTRQVPPVSYAPPVKPVSPPAYVPKELEEEPEVFEETPAIPEEEPPKPQPAPAFEPPRVERPAAIPQPAKAEPPSVPAPAVEPPKAEEPPAKAPEPARPAEPAKPAEPQAANFTMDSYVSDILGKYLKK